MFRNKYSNFLTVLLVIAIIAIIVICIIIGTKIYKSNKNEQDSKQAIAEFLTNTTSNVVNTDTNTTTLPDDTNLVVNGIVAGENVPTSGETRTTTTRKVKFYKEFVMIGYIEIPKTNINYPILTETTAEALETSVGVLYPTDPVLNQKGNVVIIGHNYRNGKFFSNNKKLAVGDKINITDETGKKLTYTIYEIFKTTPEDTTYITRDTGDNTEISLSTCTDDGSMRLIILAKV